MFVDYNAIETNSKLSENIGKEILIFLKHRLHLLMVMGYKQSLNDEDEEEPYTVVYLTNGEIICLEVDFDEFDHVFRNYQEKSLKDANKTV